MTPEERQAIANIGAQLVALAGDSSDSTPDVDDVVAIAADVAAVVAEDVAEAVVDQAADDAPTADETADLIVTSELAHAAAQVEVIEAQAAADVAVIEAEAAAEVDVIEALDAATDDGQSGDQPDDGDDGLGVLAPLVVDDGDGGAQDVPPDVPPSPSHPWFRPMGRRR